MSGERWLWFIAGPNGAGKSTRAKEFLGGLGEIVNPDEIAREISVLTPEEGLAAAGRAAIARRRELLKSGRSFSIETTLSGRTLFRFAKDARQKAWKIGLLYIGLRSSGQAIERVHLRVKSGGHDVPPGEVRRRYARSLANLSSFVALADHAVFVDNSGRHRWRVLLEIVEQRIRFRGHKLPSWLTKNLSQANTRKSPRRR